MSTARSQLLLISLDHGRYKSLGSLQSASRPNPTDATCSVVGIPSQASVVTDDVPQAGLVTMTAVHQEPGELRVDKGVSPLSPTGWESDTFELECVNPSLKDGVVAPV